MISIYNLEESDKWDAIVKEFKQYDIYYLSSYSKAFQIHGDGEPLLIYYEHTDFKAINVVMKRDIAKVARFKGLIDDEKYFDLSTPYGYGGFLVEGEVNEDSINELNREYITYCKQNNIISEFVRFHPVLQNMNTNRKIYETVTLGDTITMELDSKELIWSNLTSKNRNVIRKAKKNGVEIFWGRSLDLLKTFVPMYNKTMDNDEADTYYYFENEFYNSILNDLKYESMIFYAKHNDIIISAAIILFKNTQMHYHLSASDYSYRNLAASNLLLYEVACWGSENGFATFHLGGGLGSKDDGLLKFKKAFNKNSQSEFSIGKKIFDIPNYKKLTSLRTNKIEDSSYFPEYRS